MLFEFVDESGTILRGQFVGRDQVGTGFLLGEGRLGQAHLLICFRLVPLQFLYLQLQILSNDLLLVLQVSEFAGLVLNLLLVPFLLLLQIVLDVVGQFFQGGYFVAGFLQFFILSFQAFLFLFQFFDGVFEFCLFLEVGLFELY